MTIDAELVLTDAPVMLDVVSQDGRILYANGTQERTLGFSPGGLRDVQIEKIYPEKTWREMTHKIADISPGETADFQRLRIRRNDRTFLDVVATINVFTHPKVGRCARIAKFPINPLLRRMEHIDRENEVLSSIVETARDASWCIEFVEPVDLTAPDREIIRQVFENECYWRYCNDAMARLYRLPNGLVFNEQNVRDVFAHNAENEAFVQELINNNFHVDGAPSLDQRYDDVAMYAENDVRAHIRDGQLHRMWGTVRDLSRQKMREQEILGQATAALDVLGAAPDPIIVVNADNHIEGANPAVEWSFGWPVDNLLGTALDDLMQFDSLTTPPTGAGLTTEPGRRLAGTVTCHDGRQLLCEANIACFEDDTSESRMVVVLRVDAGSRSLMPQALEGGAS